VARERNDYSRKSARSCCAVIGKEEVEKEKKENGKSRNLVAIDLTQLLKWLLLPPCQQQRCGATTTTTPKG